MTSIFDVSADPTQLDAFYKTGEQEGVALRSLATELRQLHMGNPQHNLLDDAVAIENLLASMYQTHELVQATSTNLKAADNRFSFFEMTHDLHDGCSYPANKRYKRYKEFHDELDEMIAEGKPLKELQRLERSFVRNELGMMPESDGDYYEALVASGVQPFIALQRASSPQQRIAGFTPQDNSDISDAMLKGRNPVDSGLSPEFFPLEYRELHERLTIKKQLEKQKDNYDGTFGIGKNEAELSKIKQEMHRNDAAIALLTANGQFTKSGKASSVATVVALQKPNVRRSSVWAANYSADAWLRDQDYGSEYGDHGLNNIDVRQLGKQLENDSDMAVHFFHRLGAIETGKIPTLIDATKQANFARKEGLDVLDSYGRALALATSQHNWYKKPGSFTGEELLKAPFGWHGSHVRHSSAMLFKDGTYDQEFLASGLLAISGIGSIYDPEVFATMDVMGRHGYGPRSILLEAVARSGPQTSSHVVQHLANEGKLGHIIYPRFFNEGYNGYDGYISVFEQASRDEKSAQLLLDRFTRSDNLDDAIKDPTGLEKYQAKALEQILANNVAASIPSEGLGNVQRRKIAADITGNGAITEFDAKRWNYAVARVMNEGGGEHYYASVLGMMGQSFDNTLARRADLSGSSLSLRQDLIDDGTEVADFTGKARHMLYEMRLEHNKNLDTENAKKKKHIKNVAGLATKKVPPIYKPITTKAITYSVDNWLNLPTDNMVGFMGSEYDIEAVDTIRARQGMLELLARNGYVEGFTLVPAQSEKGWPAWIVAKTDAEGEPILENGAYEAATEEDFSIEGNYRETKIAVGPEKGELLVSEVLDYESEVTAADEKAWAEQKMLDEDSGRSHSDLSSLFSVDVTR